MQKEYNQDIALNQLPLFRVEERLASYKQRLCQELASKNLFIDFHLWISDEWFCPDGVPGFALPFYLFNPALMALHKKETGSVEGCTEYQILKLMRHELGHAIDNAFALRKDKQRVTLFGPSDQDYPDFYTPKPFSKNFVRYLGDHYAQSHPDEDFAETFAYWLDPQKDWQTKKLSRKVREKLNYIDTLMKQVRQKKPVLKNKYRVDCIEKNTSTLRAFYYLYHRRRKKSALKRLDCRLKQGFRTLGEVQKPVPLSFFLKKEKQHLKKQLSEAHGIYQYEAERALQKIIERAEQLKITGSIKEFRKKTPELIEQNFKYLKTRQLLAVYL